MAQAAAGSVAAPSADPQPEPITPVVPPAGEAAPDQTVDLPPGLIPVQETVVPEPEADPAVPVPSEPSATQPEPVNQTETAAPELAAASADPVSAPAEPIATPTAPEPAPTAPPENPRPEPAISASNVEPPAGSGVSEPTAPAVVPVVPESEPKPEEPAPARESALPPAVSDIPAQVDPSPVPVQTSSQALEVPQDGIPSAPMAVDQPASTPAPAAVEPPAGHITGDFAGFMPAPAAAAVTAAPVAPPVMTDALASAYSASPPITHADAPPQAAAPKKPGFRLPFLAAGGFLVMAIVAGGFAVSSLSRPEESTDIRSRAAEEHEATVLVEERVNPDPNQQTFEVVLNASTLQEDTQLQTISAGVFFSRASSGVLGEAIEALPPDPDAVPAAICWDQVRDVDGQAVWPDSCRGQAGALICEPGDLMLIDEELQGYQVWVDGGRMPQPECGETAEGSSAAGSGDQPPPGYYVKELYRENGIAVTTDMGELLEFEAVQVSRSEAEDAFTVAITARPKDPAHVQKLRELITRSPLVQITLDKPDSEAIYNAVISGASVKGTIPGLPMGEMEFVKSL